MSTTLDHGNIVFQCDTPRCGETLATETSNWEAARNLLRRAAWRPFKPAGVVDWHHRCATCLYAGASS